jgi:hypothetical protein
MISPGGKSCQLVGINPRWKGGLHLASDRKVAESLHDFGRRRFQISPSYELFECVLVSSSKDSTKESRDGVAFPHEQQTIFVAFCNALPKPLGNNADDCSALATQHCFVFIPESD